MAWLDGGSETVLLSCQLMLRRGPLGETVMMAQAEGESDFRAGAKRNLTKAWLIGILFPLISGASSGASSGANHL